MKAADLFIRCLENEDVENIFGLPGEANIDVMDVLLDSKMRFITTRHEQGAAFMAKGAIPPAHRHPGSDPDLD